MSGSSSDLHAPEAPSSVRAEQDTTSHTQDDTHRPFPPFTTTSRAPHPFSSSHPYPYAQAQARSHSNGRPDNHELFTQIALYPYHKDPDYAILLHKMKILFGNVDETMITLRTQCQYFSQRFCNGAVSTPEYIAWVKAGKGPKVEHPPPESLDSADGKGAIHPPWRKSDESDEEEIVDVVDSEDEENAEVGPTDKVSTAAKEGAETSSSPSKAATSEPATSKDQTQPQPSTQTQSQSHPQAQTSGDTPYPTSFNDIVELITTGQPVPGIKKIPNTVLTGQESAPKEKPRPKPWEKHGADEGKMEDDGAGTSTGTGNSGSADKSAAGAADAPSGDAQ